MAEDDDRRRPRRPSLKTPSSFNNPSNWKDKLRENCYKKVQENRASLLWKMRLSKSGKECVDDKEYIKSTFADIVADEFKRIKNSTMDEDSATLTSVPNTDDMLWSYDGLHTTHEGECEDILIEMQRIFYEDLRAEQDFTEEGTRITTWEDEEDEYLARAVFEHMQLNDKQEHKVIWCPICKKGELQEKFSLITCTLCEFKLNRSTEITLELLKERLGEAHAEHYDRGGCKLKPKFCIETRFGLTALYMECQGCNTFEVVV